MNTLLEDRLPLSDGSSCEYDKCPSSTTSTSIHFENEMGEHKEPPSDAELPPIGTYKPTCVQGREWHAFNPLNCNALHELETGMSTKDGRNRIKFLAQGGRRNAWLMDEQCHGNVNLNRSSSRRCGGTNRTRNDSLTISVGMRWH